MHIQNIEPVVGNCHTALPLAARSAEAFVGVRTCVLVRIRECDTLTRRKFMQLSQRLGHHGIFTLDSDHDNASCQDNQPQWRFPYCFRYSCILVKILYLYNLLGITIYFMSGLVHANHYQKHPN